MPDTHTPAKELRGIARQNLAWQMVAEGKTQREIGAAFGTSQANISQLLARSELRILGELKDTVEVYKRKQIEVLERIVSMALTQFEKSCEKAAKISERTDSDVTMLQGANVTVPGTMTPRKKSRHVEQQDQYGDPRFLAEARHALGEIREILGLNAPTKIAPTDPTGTKEYDPLSDDEKARRIYAILQAAKDRHDKQQHKAGADTDGAELSDGSEHLTPHTSAT